MNSTNTPTAVDNIVEETTINAPAQRVFEAFTSPSERVKWWGVAGRFQTTHVNSDLRPGGRWAMRGTRQDGKPFTVKGEYRVVQPLRCWGSRGCLTGRATPPNRWCASS